MAGHNKWSKIRHRKAIVDKRRGKAWTKCAKAIIVAAKHGGADPSINLALRYAIDEARYENMPNDTIDRAIKKGAGGEDTSSYEVVRYEGYGPGGVAIVVDALTDNRTRTAADVRLIFDTNSGNLGTTGCVSFLFETRGRIVLSGEASQEVQLFEAAAAAGADDLKFEPEDASEPEGPGQWTVLTSVPAYNAAKAALEKAGFSIVESRIQPVATTLTRVESDNAKALIDLVDELEDNDDVQRVSTNADIPDDVLAKMNA